MNLNNGKITNHPPSRRDSHKVNHRALSYGKRHKHNFFYPTANTKHTGFMARTLHLLCQKTQNSSLHKQPYPENQAWSSAASVGGNQSQGYGALRDVGDQRL